MTYTFKHKYWLLILAVAYNLTCVYFGIKILLYIENNIALFPQLVTYINSYNNLFYFLYSVFNMHRLFDLLLSNGRLTWLLIIFLFLFIYLLDRLLHRQVRFHLSALLVLTLFIFPGYSYPTPPILLLYVFFNFFINYTFVKRVLIYVGKYRICRYTLLILLFLPFMALIFPRYLLFFFKNEKPKLKLNDTLNKYVPLFLPIFLISIYFTDGISHYLPQSIINKHNDIYQGIVYDLKIDKKTDRLLATDEWNNYLLLFDLKSSSLSRKIKLPSGRLERIIIDEQTRQLFHCDYMRRKLLTYDLDTFDLKYISQATPRGKGNVAIGFARPTQTLISVFEYDGNSAIFPDPFDYSNIFQVPPCNHHILYNPYRHSFLLSFYRDVPYFLEYNIENHQLNKIDAPYFQMEFELDSKRELIYLTLPLKNDIFAYDARTLKLMKRIPTLVGARPLAYDDLHDLLIVGSLINGEVEIINLSTNERKKKKTFAYYQRDIALDKDRRRAYVGSIQGLFYFDY